MTRSTRCTYFCTAQISKFQPKIVNIFWGCWRSAPKHFFANEYWISVFPHLLCRILHFFCDFFSEICPDFAKNSREEWRVSLFQSNLRKQTRKLPKILKSDSVKIIHYYILLFIIIHLCPRSSCLLFFVAADPGVMLLRLATSEGLRRAHSSEVPRPFLGPRSSAPHRLYWEFGIGKCCWVAKNDAGWISNFLNFLNFRTYTVPWTFELTACLIPKVQQFSENAAFWENPEKFWSKFSKDSAKFWQNLQNFEFCI